MQQDYAGRVATASDEETRAGKELEHERWLGKQVQKTAINEYKETWGDHAWKETWTRQSFRRFANQLAESQTL